MKAVNRKSKNTQQIKAVLKDWVKLSDKVNSDPFKLDKSPPWAENALLEVIKVVMPHKRLPAGEENLELIGELLGRMQVIGKLHNGEIPMGPETRAGYDALQKHATSQPQSPERTARNKALTRDFQTRLKATNHVIPHLMKAALNSQHEDAVKFQKGLLRGMSIEPDGLAAGKIFQRHTLTFLVLGTQRRRFSKCRSVTEVHRILCNEFGEERIGSLKTFENRVAKKIGMRFSRSGRPAKGK